MGTSSGLRLWPRRASEPPPDPLDRVTQVALLDHDPRLVGAARVLKQGCSRYLRSINEREAEVADDPAIGQRTGRDVDHGDEARIRRVNEVANFRLGE